MTKHDLPLITQTLYEGVMTLSLGATSAHALSSAMIAALHRALDRAAQSPQVRVVVIHGPGKIFCAGHDLKEIKVHRADPDQGEAYLRKLFSDCGAMMLRLATMPQPTLAVVEGVATAGGLQLMTSCDLVFASEGARFCLPGVNNGGFCTTPSVAVSRKLSRTHMAELAFSGEMFGADWALRTGLVTRVCPAEVLYEQAEEFAVDMATRHAPALQSGKAMLYAQMDMPLEQAYAEATEVMVGHFMDPARIARDLA